MATVIEQGTFRKVHSVCNSVIEFSLRELKQDYSTDYLGDRDYYRYLICPACGNEMKFPQYGNIN